VGGQRRHLPWRGVCGDREPTTLLVSAAEPWPSKCQPPGSDREASADGPSSTAKDTLGGTLGPRRGGVLRSKLKAVP
jgi:hypothetical protein